MNIRRAFTVHTFFAPGLSIGRLSNVLLSNVSYLWNCYTLHNVVKQSNFYDNILSVLFARERNMEMLQNVQKNYQHLLLLIWTELYNFSYYFFHRLRIGCLYLNIVRTLGKKEKYDAECFPSPPLLFPLSPSSVFLRSRKYLHQQKLQHQQQFQKQKLKTLVNDICQACNYVRFRCFLTMSTVCVTDDVYSVRHRFKFMNQDDYFQFIFDHFIIEHLFFEAAEGSSRNWLELKTKRRLQACPNWWNTS